MQPGPQGQHLSLRAAQSNVLLRIHTVAVAVCGCTRRRYPSGVRDDNDNDDDFGGDEDFERVPLDRDEAARVRRDLDDLAAFRRTFEPEGFRGVSMFCSDCAEEHFYEWSMLEENLRALLESGEVPVHEPAFDPKPDEYVDWEYAQGYLDGLADGGSPLLPVHAPEGSCPHCGHDLPGGGDEALFCPACGSSLSTARIARALLDRGWSKGDVAELLRGARVPPLRGL